MCCGRVVIDGHRSYGRIRSRRSRSLFDVLPPKGMISYWYRRRHHQLNEGNLFEVAELYDEHFQRHTEQHYKEALWPSTDVVRGIVGDGMLILMFMWRRVVSLNVSPCRCSILDAI